MTDEEIELEIRARLRELQAAGLTIDMRGYGIEAGEGGRYVLMDVSRPSVCAIGAAMLGEPVVSNMILDSFADKYGRSTAWAAGFAAGTMGEELSGQDPDYTTGLALGLRLRDWAQKALGL